MNAPEMDSPKTSDLTKCRVCGGDLRSLWWARFDDVLVKRCRNCRLINMERFGDVPDYWSAARNAFIQNPSAYYGNHSYGVCDILERRTEPGRLLDIGCSLGGVVFNARRRGWDAKGLDLNQDAIDLGSAHCPGLICAKVEDQGFEPDSFDAIVMWHTLEHIEFPESFLQEILRILKPGGQYLLEVPNVSSPIAWLFYRRRWLGFETPQHYYAYQKSTLLPLLERSGLEPLQVWQPVIAGRFPGGWKGFLRSTLFGTLARMSWGDGLRVLARKPS